MAEVFPDHVEQADRNQHDQYDARLPLKNGGGAFPTGCG